MKVASLILGLVTTTLALAAPRTTVRIPLMLSPDGYNETIVHSSVLNPRLVKAGVPALPTTIEIADDEKDIPGKIQRLNKLVNASLSKIGYHDGILASDNVPGDMDPGATGFETCFTGDPDLVAEVTTRVGPAIYSPLYEVIASRYQDDMTDGLGRKINQETNAVLTEGSVKWQKWDARLDAVLIISTVGEDRDDMQESVLKRCR